MQVVFNHSKILLLFIFSGTVLIEVLISFFLRLAERKNINSIKVKLWFYVLPILSIWFSVGIMFDAVCFTDKSITINRVSVFSKKEILYSEIKELIVFSKSRINSKGQTDSWKNYRFVKMDFSFVDVPQGALLGESSDYLLQQLENRKIKIVNK